MVRKLTKVRLSERPYQQKAGFLMDQEFNLYYTTRNAQIAEMKTSGMKFSEIADLMCLSKGYVKELAHKQGIYGPVRNYKKVPVRKCPMCGHTAMFQDSRKSPRGESS